MGSKLFSWVTQLVQIGVKTEKAAKIEGVRTSSIENHRGQFALIERIQGREQREHEVNGMPLHDIRTKNVGSELQLVGEGVDCRRIVSR